VVPGRVTGVNHLTSLANRLGRIRAKSYRSTTSIGGPRRRQGRGARRLSVIPGEEEEDGVPPLTGGSHLSVGYRIGI
jgi:hypothetical protein